MKRYLLFFCTTGLLYVSLSSSSSGPSSTPQGVQTAKNGCGGAGCHGSTFTPTNSTIDLIEDGQTSPVADGKYKPNGSYTIGVTVFAPNAQKFGFIMLVTDAAGNQAGTLANPLSLPQAKITTKGQFTVAEHPSPISPVGGGLAVPGLDWTAPPKGKGAVTFYVAVNAVNNNGSADAGDNYVLLSKTYQEGFPVSVEDVEREIEVIAYPNPATNLLNIDIQNSTSNKYHYTIYSLAGTVAAQGHLGNNVNTVDVSALASGTHFMSITNGSEQKVITFNKL